MISTYTPEQNQLLDWLLDKKETTNKFLIGLREQAQSWKDDPDPLFPVPLSQKQLAALKKTYETIYKPREQTNQRTLLLGGPHHQESISLPPEASAITITTPAGRATYVADKIGGARVFLHQPLASPSKHPGEAIQIMEGEE